MKRFSTWLTSSKPKYQALTKGYKEKLEVAAHNYHTSTVPDPNDPTKQIKLSQARGNTRLTAKDLVETLGNLLQEALIAYFNEVVRLTYVNLHSEAAKKALSIEWDMLLHAPGKARLQNLQDYIAAIDEFSKHYSQKRGQITVWEDKPITTPGTGEEGYIPEIGMGYTDSFIQGIEAPWLGDPGEIQLEDTSKRRFEKGAPGSAWVGVLLNGRRTGGNRSVAYLVPALHMEKHLSMPHNDEIGVAPVEQWGASGHHEATVRLINEGRIPRTNWHRTEFTPEGVLKEPGDASSCGVLMGFAIVKAYNAIGHQWAFISGTLNATGTDDWVAGPDGIHVPQKKGDSFRMPGRWAIAVWKATKDLVGGVYVCPGSFKRSWEKPVEVVIPKIVPKLGPGGPPKKDWRATYKNPLDNNK